MAERDEVEELRARLEQLEGKKPPSASVTTLKVVGTLAALVVGVLLVLAVAGTMVPKETPEQRAAKLEQQINARCDVRWTGSEEASSECQVREHLAAVDR